MSNIFDNRVSTEFTQEELDRAGVLFASLTQLYQPKTIALNKKELKKLRSIKVNNFVFVDETQKTLDREGLDLLPPSVAGQADELKKDVAFYLQLSNHKVMLDDILTRVNHTMRMLAHESLKVSNAIYEQYQLQAEDGVPGAASRYEQLKDRYAKRGVGRPVLDK